MKYFLPSFALLLTLALASCGASKEVVAEAAAAKSSLEQCQTELASTQQELVGTQQELAQARSVSGSTSEQVNQLQAEKAQLQNELANTQNQLAAVTQQMQATSDDYGVWFRVQIGAYEERHIDQNLETTDQLSLEEQNKLQKISLGRFRNYEDAKQLQDQLQAMGVKDAWVVSYQDGVRVPIEQVRN